VTDELTYIALHLKYEDMLEAYRASGCPPLYSIIEGWEKSAIRKMYYDSAGNPMSVVGVINVAAGWQGRPWMLSTSRLSECPLRLARESRKLLTDIRGRYNYLENYVDATNTTSIEWLEVHDFSIHEPEPLFPYGYKFRRFSWEA